MLDALGPSPRDEDDGQGRDGVAPAVRGGSYVELPSEQDGAASPVALSAEAYRLHLYALSDSVVDGHPGRVTDEYLQARSVDDRCVRELCAVASWEAVEGGYRILDEEALAAIVATFEEAGRVAQDCLTGTGHFEDPSNPGFCAVCHSPVGALPPGPS